MKAIFSFTSYRTFLKATLDERVKRHPGMSLRSFARQLGISPSYLSRAISGSKQLSAEAARKISLALDHSLEEADYFLNLVELESSQEERGRARIQERIERRRSDRKTLPLETFRVLADWYFFAVLALIESRGFKAQPTWIAERLGIEPQQARLALDRLLAAGLIERVGENKVAVTPAGLSASNEVAEPVIQEHHRQHLMNALRSLNEPSTEEREFACLNLSFNKADLARARAFIRIFNNRFNDQFRTKSGDEVYQLSVQFFPLTKELKVRAHSTSL